MNCDEKNGADRCGNVLPVPQRVRGSPAKSCRAACVKLQNKVLPIAIVHGIAFA
jgi:hypothetical protein